MAIVSEVINNDLWSLRSFMIDANISGCNPAYSGGNTLSIEDRDENIIASLSITGNKLKSIMFNAYISNPSVYIQNRHEYCNLVNAWRCSNGIMLDLYNNTGYGEDAGHRHVIMISKTNDGKIAFVFNNPATIAESRVGGFKCVCYGNAPDDLYPDITIPTIQRSGCVLVPFMTKTNQGVAQYTYKSGFLPFNTSYGAVGDGPKEMVMNGIHYITDTYVAIEDEGDIPPNSSST